MQYSVPIWTDAEGGPRGDLEGKRASGDLETAQARKIQHILTKARLRPGDRLLEVGSGWGGVAIAVCVFISLARRTAKADNVGYRQLRWDAQLTL